MNIWEFRKLVRQNRSKLHKDRCCALGAACYPMKGHDTNPVPNYAADLLEVPRLYCMGVAHGWDNYVSKSSTDGLPSYIKGYRYGRRMARITRLKENYEYLGIP